MHNLPLNRSEYYFLEIFLWKRHLNTHKFDVRGRNFLISAILVLLETFQFLDFFLCTSIEQLNLTKIRCISKILGSSWILAHTFIRPFLILCKKSPSIARLLHKLVEVKGSRKQLFAIISPPICRTIKNIKVKLCSV
jgi:hypothetical protein